MQIGNLNTAANAGDAAVPTTARRPASTNVSATQEADEPDELIGAVEPAEEAEAGSQDSAVSISAAGAAAAADDNGDDQGDASEAPDAPDAPDASDMQAAQDAGDDENSTTDVSPVKSFTYGVLGLERPDEAKDPNELYSAGRWLAAGLTIGGLISFFA